MRAESQRAPAGAQRAAVDQFGAGFGERAFVEVRKSFIQFPGQSELQHGVAEELEALVVLHGRAQFVGDGWMGHRELQEAFIAEGVTESDLQCSEVRHGSSSVRRRRFGGFGGLGNHLGHDGGRRQI